MGDFTVASRNCFIMDLAFSADPYSPVRVASAA